MDETLIKVALLQGGAVAALVIGAVVFVRHLVPLARDALAAHQVEVKEVLAAHKREVDSLIDAFREGLDRGERLMWQQFDENEARREEARRQAPPPPPMRRQDPRPEATEEAPTRRLRRITAPLVLLLLLLCTAPACTPAQRAAAQVAATRAAVDLGLCAARGVSGQEVRRWGEALGSSNWRSVVGDVSGLAVGCALHALVTGLSQDQPHGPMPLKRRLEQMAEGADPARAHAAQLLLEGVRAGRVVLPPEAAPRPRSGEG